MSSAKTTEAAGNRSSTKLAGYREPPISPKYKPLSLHEIFILNECLHPPLSPQPEFPTIMPLVGLHVQRSIQDGRAHLHLGTGCFRHGQAATERPRRKGIFLQRRPHTRLVLVHTTLQATAVFACIRSDGKRKSGIPTGELLAQIDINTTGKL